MKMPEVSATVSELGVVAAIAISHMSMPNHWLPYALVGAGQQWSIRRTILVSMFWADEGVSVAFAGATGHAAMTIVTVALLSGLGGTVLSHEAYRTLSSLLLLILGGYYLYSYFVQRRRNACCGKDENKETSSLPTTVPRDGSSTDSAAVLSLIAMTSLSPCVGSMPVLLAFLKPPLSFERVVMAGAVLQLAASGVMCSLVTLFMLGANRVDFGQLRRHERLFLGVSFVALAALTYFVFANEGGGEHHGHGHHYPGVIRDSERMSEMGTTAKSHHSCHHH